MCGGREGPSCGVQLTLYRKIQFGLIWPRISDHTMPDVMGSSPHHRKRSRENEKLFDGSDIVAGGRLQLMTGQGQTGLEGRWPLERAFRSRW